MLHLHVIFTHESQTNDIKIGQAELMIDSLYSKSSNSISPDIFSLYIYMSLLVCLIYQYTIRIIVLDVTTNTFSLTDLQLYIVRVMTY
jgi:hypothetical protein